MDTITAPTPVAAPAAVTPAAPAAERPLNSVTKKPITEAAHSLFKMLQETENPMREDAPEKEPAATAAVASPEKQPDAAAPAEAAVKVSKKVVKRPELPTAPQEAAPVTRVEAPAPTDSKWEDDLLDDEKSALDDARFAEKVDAKHKGLADRMGKFFREQKKYLEDHPDATEDDSAYKKILASAPALSSLDKRAISTARIKEEVSKDYQGKFEEVEQKLYERDEEPKIENEGVKIRSHLAFNALPKEMLDILKTKGTAEGVKTLQKDYADEMEVASEIITGLVDDSKELLRITRVNPKTGKPIALAADAPSHPKWEQHDRIALMVNEACRDFQKSAPQNEQVRDGKWFVTREEWAKLPATARHQFWTFTNSEDHVREMIGRAMSWAPEAISSRIKTRQEALKARGYERRRPEAAAAAPAVPPVASNSPASPRSTPAPAPTATPAGQLTVGQQLARRLSAPLTE